MTDSLTTPGLPEKLYPTAQMLRRTRTAILFAPDAEERAMMAAAVGLLALPAFRMTGEVRPEGRHDLRLDARITARVVQPCSVTLVPVETRIDDPVLRRYQVDWQEPDAAEVELTEDDSTEAMPVSVDAAAVAMEALSLALPLYPRAPGAALGEAVFAPPGAEPLRDDDLRPFAGLSALVQKPDPEQGK
ncbi:MAG: YceD family protein [Paracoccaceae bacterium]